MADRKLDDAAWAEAEKRYRETDIGFGKLAAELGVSKGLVARKLKNVQKNIGVTMSKNAPKPVTKAAAPSGALITENAGASEKRTPDVYGVDGQNRPFGAAHSPVADQTYQDDVAVPDNLDDAEREAFIRAAILERQKQINARHAKELRAARGKIYEAIKVATEKSGAGAALAVQRTVAALLSLQGAELESELERVKLSLNEFAGKPKGPNPARIVVVIDGRRVDCGTGHDAAMNAMRLGNGQSTGVIDMEVK